MTSKTARQQAEMKKQTYGVEIEMYNITRDKAAAIIAKHLGSRIDNTDRSIYDKHLMKDSQGREWMIERDGSILARRDDERVEMVTPPLNYDDIEDLQEIIRELRAAGAKSDPDHECGIHVHIGIDGHNAKTLRNLTNLMASHESLLINSLKLSDRRTGQWCKKTEKRYLDEINRKKPKTMNELADIWYTSQDAGQGRHSHYNGSRYHMLNLHGAFEAHYYNHTLEFRMFQFDNPGRTYKGGLHAGKIKTFIQLSMALSQAAKDAKSISPKESQSENEKFTMRTWLIRMGMVGDEFKTARDLLTRNLKGNAAWRHGAAA